MCVNRLCPLCKQFTLAGAPETRTPESCEDTAASAVKVSPFTESGNVVVVCESTIVDHVLARNDSDGKLKKE
jgi:hypothetical protein